MKVLLRVLLLLVSIGILVYAALPPFDKEKSEEATQEAVPETNETPSSDPNLVRDFLGGAQLDAGNKAQDTLNKVNQSRQEKMDEMGME